MSTFNSPTNPSRGGPAENDIYTVLMVISFLTVLIATIYVGYRAQTLFGSVFPPPGS